MSLKIKAGLASRRIAGELFIVDAAGSRLHELNGTAAVIWEAFAAGKGPEAAARSLAREYEVPEAEALADCRAFARELEEAGLLLPG